MSLQQVNLFLQIAASIAVVASLIFVGIQIKGNTLELQRNEHNSTMAQWTVIRMAMVKHRDIAELMSAGLNGEVPMDRPTQLRMEQMLQEIAWASFHIWDRTQRGVFPKGTFEFTGGAYLCGLLKTPRGGEWWNRAKRIAFHPAFVADVDAQLNTDLATPAVLAPPEQ